VSVEYEIIDITPENEGQYDLFCKKSKRKEEGYQAKKSWFKERYQEGLRMKVLYVKERKMTSRGFIEYVPGEFSWRAVNAPGYMVIHCLWVVGKWKKKGFGKMLLEACIEDAKKQGMLGVAMPTNEGTWVTGKKLLLKNGFEVVDAAPEGFELVVKRFKKDAPLPSFPKNWDERQKRYKKGMTVFYTNQCPYLPEAVEFTKTAAEEIGIPFKAIELKTAKEVQEKSPSSYGVFGIVYEGKLLSYLYLKKEEIQKRVQS